MGAQQQKQEQQEAAAYFRSLSPEQRAERIRHNQAPAGEEGDFYTTEELDDTEWQKVRTQLDEQEQQLTPGGA